MSVELETDVTAQTVEQHSEQEQNNPLHALQQAIANMPAIDAEKVQAVLKKLQANGLDILGTEEERLAAAQRIAQQIIDENPE